MIVTQYFTPEVTAARFRLEPFVDELVDRGHEVRVVCAVPNHPKGVVEPAYRGRLRVRRTVRRATIDHVWVLARPRKTTLTRLGSYGSFAALATAVGTIGQRPDVILASSPPLPVGAAAALLAVRHRAPWVLDVRDIWPDSAVALGELSDPRAIALAERLERWLYRNAAAIVTVNDAFAEQIASVAPTHRTIDVIPNGTTRLWLEAGDAEPDRRAAGFPPDRFVWAYAGNVGLAHGLEAAVEAAGRLGDGFRLVVIGEGPRRNQLEQLAAAIPTGAVELRTLMAPSEAARHLRAADALVVSERQAMTVASKLYDYCAIGRPVVAACRGELRRVVEEAGIGLAVPHGDARAIAEAVRSLRDDPELASGLARRGREFASRHLREAQASRLADLLERVVGA